MMTIPILAMRAQPAFWYRSYEATTSGEMEVLWGGMLLCICVSITVLIAVDLRDIRGDGRYSYWDLNIRGGS